LTKTDPLTGILNRSHLFRLGRNLIDELFNKNQKVSLLLLDVDSFKKINDDFGHHVGDLILIKVANLISETMRYRDTFARLGGEEFVAILPHTDLDLAKSTAIRIKEKISQYCFDDLGVDRMVSVSIGVASLDQILKQPKGFQSKEGIFDRIIHAADLAMYQAKSQGRNSVVVYDETIELQERRYN